MSMGDATLSLLRDLIAFDTTSHLSNLALIEYVENYLDGLSIPYVRIPNAEETKSSLLARIGPEAPGGIILSGHTDVVPVEGQEWHTHPFSLTEREGRLYGRGTSDMKGFLACALALAPKWARMDLKAPVWLALSYDEEVGCLGAPDLVRHIMEHVPQPRLVIIGEPTGMRVVTGHKGVYSYETVVTGKEAHSSQPHLGVNAVHASARLVAALAGMAKRLEENGPHDMRYTPAWPTVHVGVIEGGTARNIIPRECRFVWEIRPLPGHPAEPLMDEFNEICKELSATTGSRITTHSRSHMEGFQSSLNEEETALILHCARANATHAVSFGTEAGVFHTIGKMPVIVCGPGEIDQAHKPDEFIEYQQLELCLGFLERLFERLSAGS